MEEFLAKLVLPKLVGASKRLEGTTETWFAWLERRAATDAGGGGAVATFESFALRLGGGGGIAAGGLAGLEYRQ